MSTLSTPRTTRATSKYQRNPATTPAEATRSRFEEVRASFLQQTVGINAPDSTKLAVCGWTVGGGKERCIVAGCRCFLLRFNYDDGQKGNKVFHLCPTHIDMAVPRDKNALRDMVKRGMDVKRGKDAMKITDVEVSVHLIEKHMFGALATPSGSTKTADKRQALVPSPGRSADVGSSSRKRRACGSDAPSRRSLTNAVMEQGEDDGGRDILVEGERAVSSGPSSDDIIIDDGDGVNEEEGDVDFGCHGGPMDLSTILEDESEGDQTLEDDEPFFSRVVTEEVLLKGLTKKCILDEPRIVLPNDTAIWEVLDDRALGNYGDDNGCLNGDGLERFFAHLKSTGQRTFITTILSIMKNKFMDKYGEEKVVWKLLQFLKRTGFITGRFAGPLGNVLKQDDGDITQFLKHDVPSMGLFNHMVFFEDVEDTRYIKPLLSPGSCIAFSPQVFERFSSNDILEQNKTLSSIPGLVATLTKCKQHAKSLASGEDDGDCPLIDGVGTDPKEETIYAIVNGVLFALELELDGDDVSGNEEEANPSVKEPDHRRGMCTSLADILKFTHESAWKTAQSSIAPGSLSGKKISVASGASEICGTDTAQSSIALDSLSGETQSVASGASEKKSRNIASQVRKERAPTQPHADVNCTCCSFPYDNDKFQGLWLDYGFVETKGPTIVSACTYGQKYGTWTTYPAEGPQGGSVSKRLETILGSHSRYSYELGPTHILLGEQMTDLVNRGKSLELPLKTMPNYSEVAPDLVLWLGTGSAFLLATLYVKEEVRLNDEIIKQAKREGNRFRLSDIILRTFFSLCAPQDRQGVPKETVKFIKKNVYGSCFFHNNGGICNVVRCCLSDEVYTRYKAFWMDVVVRFLQRLHNEDCKNFWESWGDNVFYTSECQHNLRLHLQIIQMEWFNNLPNDLRLERDKLYELVRGRGRACERANSEATKMNECFARRFAWMVQIHALGLARKIRPPTDEDKLMETRSNWVGKVGIPPEDRFEMGPGQGDH